MACGWRRTTRHDRGTVLNLTLQTISSVGSHLVQVCYVRVGRVDALIYRYHAELRVGLAIALEEELVRLLLLLKGYFKRFGSVPTESGRFVVGVGRGFRGGYATTEG